MKRQDCIARISQWLRRRDGAEVLSTTHYGIGGGGGAPDRRYDSVAMEADLHQAVRRLPQLERIACELSKSADRERRHWFRDVVEPRLMRAALAEWLTWTYYVEAAYGALERPFERLLSQAAEHLADDLGPGWWGPARPPRR